MITIYTAKNIEILRNFYQKASHYTVLWLPEDHCHVTVEAKKIVDFIEKNKNSPHCEIYTLRQTAVNIIGHMIMRKLIDSFKVECIVLPENQIATYDNEGYLQNWPYGFYEWDEDEVF